MNRYDGLGTILLILSMNCWKEVNANCNYVEVMECISPIIMYSIESDNTGDKFGHICSNLTDVERCIDNIDCTEEDLPAVTMWHGLRDGFGYVCQLKSNREILSSGCLKSQALTECNDEFTNSVLTDNSNYCPAATRLLTCSMEATRGCGTREVVVYSMFTYKLLQPRCPDSLHNPLSSWTDKWGLYHRIKSSACKVENLRKTLSLRYAYVCINSSFNDKYNVQYIIGFRL